MGRLLHATIFFTCREGVLDAIHIGFAALVLGTFILFPPRLPRWRAAETQPAAEVQACERHFPDGEVAARGELGKVANFAFDAVTCWRVWRSRP